MHMPGDAFLWHIALDQSPRSVLLLLFSIFRLIRPRITSLLGRSFSANA